MNYLKRRFLLVWERFANDRFAHFDEVLFFVIIVFEKVADAQILLFGLFISNYLTIADYDAFAYPQLALFAKAAGIVNIFLQESLQLMYFFFLKPDFFIFLLDLLFVRVHEFTDHLFELNNLLFHTVSQWLGLQELLL